MSRFTRHSLYSDSWLRRREERRAWLGLASALSLLAGIFTLSSQWPQRIPVGTGEKTWFCFPNAVREDDPVQQCSRAVPLVVGNDLPSPEIMSPLLAHDSGEPSLPEMGLVEIEPLPAAVAPLLYQEADRLIPPSPVSRHRERRLSAAAAPEGTEAAGAESPWVPASYRQAPAPPYPPAMRERRLQGVVGVRIHVDEVGCPVKVDITAPSGHQIMDDTARQWILRHWVFTPASRAGQPMASTVRTQVRFIFETIE